jgi:beta-1,4-glucosyltransferase
MPSRLDIAGFPVRNTTAPAARRLIERRLETGRRTVVFFANANFVVRCGHLREATRADPGILVLNDGLALDIAARLRFGAPFRDNLNGTDFTPALLAGLRRPARVYLVGGGETAVAGAASAFARLPRVEIAGVQDGFTLWADEAGAVARIAAARPDILLVALGNPRQEDWILRHREALGAPLILAVGALFDFASRRVPRAPALVRRLRLEWAHRLLLDPRRLAGRYTLGMVRFAAAVLAHPGASPRRAGGLRSPAP